jgi:molybdate transport system substrate-binding protein
MRRWSRRDWTLTNVALGAALACQERTSLGSQTELVVFAAASLREAFTALAAEYTRVSPNATVRFNFAGTQELRAQIEQGALADVFAAADTKPLEELSRQGLVLGPRVFAFNEPVVILSPDVAPQIRRFADLPRAKRIVLGAKEVPIGQYSARILDNASRAISADFREQVERRVISHELSVRQVLSKVTLGEADAGIVYRTDVHGQVRAALSLLEIPPELNVEAHYSVAVVVKSERADAAHAWLSLLLSDAGKAILVQHGFKPPSIAKSAL